MTASAAPRRGGLIIGLALILLGGAALLVQASGVQVGWPAWVIAIGVAFVLGAVAVGGSGGTGMASVGGIVAMAGVVLAVQEAYGLYATWAYAWALVAPGGVGLGLTVYGLLTGRRDDLRGGLGALLAGIVIFLVGFLFFEGVIGLSDGRFGDLTDVAVPLVLVVIGVVVLVGAFIPGPWRTPSRPAGGGWSATGSGGASPGAATDPGPTTAGAAAGAAAAGGGAAAAGGGAAGQPTDRLAIPLSGAPDAEVMLTFGAGHLAVGPAAPGMLVDGTYAGGVKAEPGGPGRIRLSPPAPSLAWDRAPYSWQVGLTGEVPLRLRLETGAADAEIDLSTLRLADLRLRTGASETRVTLPAAAGYTRVDAEGGAAAIRFRVPDGVAARIRSSMALGSTDVDPVRFPRNAAGNGWESPDFDRAPNRVEIEIRGGVGSVSIR